MDVTRHLIGIRNRGLSVRAFIVGLVATILIPTLLFGALLTLRSAASERALLERNSESKATQVATDIDHEMATAKATLVALASSQFLENEDFHGFHQQCVAVAKQLGAQFVLRDAEQGRQVVNAAVPWGEPIPKDSPSHSLEAMTEALRTGNMTISDVYFGPEIKKLIVSVGIPVTRNNVTAYYLSVGIPVDTFADALQNAALPSQWLITLVDRSDTIIARSEGQQEVAGSKVRTPDFPARGMKDGFFISANRFGIVYRWVSHRSETTGWAAVVGVPLTVLEAPARNALTIYAVAGGSLFVIAMALSFVVGGRLSQSIGEMGIDRKPTSEEFRVLFESVPSGVLVVDHSGLMLLANETMERQFGYSRDELIGHPVEMLVPERFRSGHLTLRRNYTAALESRPMGAGRELFGRRKDGSEFPIEIGLQPITTRSGNFVMATVVDVSVRVLSERRLSTALKERDDLRGRFMQAQEDERLRLAHELHDQTGQSLTASLLELKDLEAQLKDDGKNRARALRQSLEQMGKTLHRIAWELRPASIDELGLTSALSNYISEWSRQYSIDADFHCSDTRLDSLEDQRRTAIFRIVQEGLTNIAKHAQEAKSVSVLIDRSDSVLRLTIEDDGPGFEIGSDLESNEERRRGKLGLAGMRERLTLIGGELEIESSVGTGTTIFARIPLENQRLIA